MTSLRACFTHRVLSHERAADYSDLHDPTAREFRDLLISVKRGQRFVTSAEAADLAREGRPEPGLAHLSLDDGFASAGLAAEICHELDVPLTVFVNTDVLDGYVPWFVRRVVGIASGRGAVAFQGRTYALPDAGEAQRLHEATKAALQPLGREERDRAVAEMLDEMGLADAVSHASLPGKFRFLGREDLRALAGAGVEIGCHGASHVELTRCKDGELERELRDSRLRLEQILGKPVHSLSYPDGMHDERVRRAAKRAGFEAGFTVSTDPDVPWDDPLALPRLVFGRYRKHHGHA